MAKKEPKAKAAKKDADAKAANADVEKKCVAVMKRCAERVEYYDGVITRHEAGVVAAKAKKEKLLTNAERRCTNLRLKGDPRTKLQAQIKKLQDRQAKLEKDLAELQ